MTRTILAAALAFGLAACASTLAVDQAADAHTRYAAARLDLNTAIESLVDYAQQPRCSEALRVACAEQSVIDRGYALALRADESLDVARAFLDEGDYTDAQARIRAATGGLTLLRDLLARELTEES